MTIQFKHIGFKIFSIVITCFVLSCSNKRQTDWRVSYVKDHKIPFGTYILYEELDDFFPNHEKILLKKNPYDYLNDHYDSYYDNYDVSGTYVCIDRYTYTLDDEATNTILNYVATGNSAFIASNSFNDVLKNELNVDLDYESIGLYQIDTISVKNGTVNLLDFQSKTYTIDKEFKKSYFSEFDDSKTVVIGEQHYNDKSYPNFVRIQHGQGYVYLHSQPIVFTNYYMLKNQSYVSNVLSHFPKDNIIWDPHMRYRKDGENSSSLSYILSQKNLKTALLIALLSIILFVFFNAKRRQRIIPIIRPLKNTTVDFTKTIGNLYFQQNNNADLINKKIIFFLEKIRADYLLDTKNLNQDFIKKLSDKSGKSIGEVKLLINTIHKLKNSHLSSREDLFRLNQLIEKFYKS